ncbi:MAG: isoprenylcysteine carboxylmethyltransferase family protein [Aurantimonas endophytica]|uniref:Protein-S-isoprenylcysteine O-methyltransferase Ste14 n=1 Tax=Aurantimonas endophytica TaxID=1522175 RepID=A0A7W6MP93_9HYPH|nr:isoprenylcysteine carboxylmethyltransferase family protein [Aurantimonas endophytica]MBB4002705.1 protein-S-isoprenylcysteine O-methyltransferase Ste14 [Aurantimonas endophytica]MCO6403584.1 isoprenylcysteine carboxylmethyltransferase family protein [Aurantimonas endophytica]
MALGRYQQQRKLALFAILVGAFMALLFVGSAWPEEIHETIEVVGLGLIVVGIAGRIWCTLYIGGRKAAEIVAEGPYSISRNPLYVFSSIAAGGAGAATGSIVLGLVFMVGCAAAFRVVILREEAYLREAFGASFDSYVARVPRFFPDISLFRDVPKITVDMALVYRTMGDGLVFFAAMPFFETVEMLQAGGYLPVLLRLY